MKLNCGYSKVPRDFRPDITSPTWLTRRLLLDAVIRYAPEFNGKLLDFGCGAKPYKSLFTVDEYIGVDYEGEGHDHKNESIDFFYDGKVLPFSAECFDGIFSTEVFEHVFNLPPILDELYRVLKPGGIMLITCPFAICEHEQPNDFARYSSFGIRYLLEEHGFEVVRQEKLGNAVETLWQMRITYLNLHVIRKVRKIPVIRSVVRYGLNSCLNVLSRIGSWLSPKANDLYLNNLILVKKAGS